MREDALIFTMTLYMYVAEINYDSINYNGIHDMMRWACCCLLCGSEAVLDNAGENEWAYNSHEHIYWHWVQITTLLNGDFWKVGNNNGVPAVR